MPAVMAMDASTEPAAPRAESLDAVPDAAAARHARVCRVATEALSCISARCFDPEGKPSSVSISGRVGVRIDFDAGGAITAFNPERDDAAWHPVLVCARRCVAQSVTPRACTGTIYLHVP